MKKTQQTPVLSMLFSPVDRILILESEMEIDYLIIFIVLSYSEL